MATTAPPSSRLKRATAQAVEIKAVEIKAVEIKAVR
jgi:hypothetical protein